MKLQFLGAAGTVTGSKYLVESDGKRILIDCGLFQGLKELRLRNRASFPVPPSSIHAAVLTHAHLDHTGYLPLLVKNGFRGPIYSTPGTKDLARILLADSGKIQEEEAEYANRKGFSKHKPALPLYTQQDAENCMSSFVTKDYEEDFSVTDTLKVRFSHSGHILGSALVKLWNQKESILFTGDLGRKDNPILCPVARVEQTDYLVVESTYGDKTHPASDPEDELKEIIQTAYQNKSVILVPAFSVGRSQLLMYYISQLKKKKRIPDIPVYLNSPLSIDATDILCSHQEEHRLDSQGCRELCGAAHYVNSVEDSKKLNLKEGPMLIISANGMATGGRILHHLIAFGPDPNNIILFTGYQAVGTRGDRLLKGEQTVKIHGQQIPIRAQIKVLHNLSAHADSAEILKWLKNFKQAPKMTFVTHGEPESAKALSEKITAELGWICKVPANLEEDTLS